MGLRCVAARKFAELGCGNACQKLIDRATRENDGLKFPRVYVLLAEAERAARLPEHAWPHFLAAIVATSGQTDADWCVSHAFPYQESGIEWEPLWFSALSRNPQRPVSQLFDRMRRAFDRSMPIDELTKAVSDVDLSEQINRPYIELAWENASRMKQAGREPDAVKFLEEAASSAFSGDLYLHLGDWACEKKDWSTAVKRYALAWQKDRSRAYPLYMEGWALERGGRSAEGRNRMELAHLLPLADEARREQFVQDLQARGLEDATIPEADVLIRTGQSLSVAGRYALSIAADRLAERGRCAAAAALWPRAR